jgi:hypothetical protein
MFPSVASTQACRVTLEYEDGRVLTGMVLVAELSVESPAATIWEKGREAYSVTNARTWELYLQGIDAPYLQMPRDEYRKQVVEPARTASEWKCDRCGAVWPRSENKCGACGFWRPFIYE